MVCEKYSNYIAGKNRTRELDLYPGNNISNMSQKLQKI